MMPYEVGLPKERYEERVREAAEDRLAARVARTSDQREHSALVRDAVSWLRALPAKRGIAVLMGRHA